MPATSTPRLRNWIERGLAEGGHPSLDRIVRSARRKPRPDAWAAIAADVSARSGESISYEALRQWFAHLDPPTEQP